MLFLLILGYFWCSIVTLLTFSININIFFFNSKNILKHIPKNLNIKQKKINTKCKKTI